ncbi:MAG: hypothetical protein MI866_10645 [Bacteroidales bacterium]|nr:hypothetical protein [Bacteroidales bacterium]
MENNKELKDILTLLRGEVNNGFICIHADLPIDAGKVVNYYKKDIVNDNDFREKFLLALRMLADDKGFSWLVMYYISSLLWLHRYSVFPLDFTEFISYFNFCLRKYESSLKQNNSWVGTDYKNGLWGDVERMATNIYEEFEVKIYPYKD